MTYVIYGAGGHAQVVADLVGELGGHVVSFFDDHEKAISHIPVIGYDDTLYPEAMIIVGVGNNEAREAIVNKMKHQAGVLIHPAAVVAKSATIGEGTVILAKAVVQANAKIGRHVIVNAGAIIDHDAVVEDFAHIGPGVYVGGGAVIGKAVTVNPGAVIMRNTVIKAFGGIPPLELIN